VTGNDNINRALLDLGASVSILPFMVYESLGLGELKPINMVWLVVPLCFLEGWLRIYFSN